MWKRTRVVGTALWVGMLTGVSVGCENSLTENVDQRKRDASARMQIDRLRIQLKVYKADVGEFPSTEQGLVALTTQPTPA